MKKRILYFSLFSAFSVYVFTSSSNGPGAVQGQDRTGSPVSSGYCGNSGCHSAGAFSPEIKIKLENSSSEEITEYIPGNTYTVKVKIDAEGSPAGYGFQSVALDSSHMNAGVFGTPGAGMRITNLDNRDYVEHSQRDTDGEFEIEWTAPDAGTGDITFYAAGNAVNGSGSSGDGADTTVLQLPEAQVSGLFDQEMASFALEISPNPVQDWVRLQWENQEVSPNQINILNATGQKIFSKNVTNAQTATEVLLQDQTAGIYFVQLVSDRGIQSKRLLKL